MASCASFDNVLRQLIQIFDGLHLQEDVSDEILLLRQHCERVLVEERQRAENLDEKTVRSCEFSKLQFPKSQKERSALRVPVRLRLRPRLLRNVSSINTSTKILGEKIDYPVCISPTGMHKLAHPDGEIATAKAAGRSGTCMVLSCWSTTSLEDVADGSSGLKWFQTDAFKQLDVLASIVKRAEAKGYKAIVFTADMPYIGKRYNNVRNDFSLPAHLSFGNLDKFLQPSCRVDQGTADALHDPSMTWDVIQWLRTVTKLPIVVKGILTAEDAKLAVQHGVDAILVSSHGGRQLDGVPATIEVLPEIVAAVGDKIEVYVDGGVRFGTDVFKALALGARAVFVGRPILYGLAYEGEEGVYKVLQMLKEELRLAMGLCGCRSLNDIVKEMVLHESHYQQAKL